MTTLAINLNSDGSIRDVAGATHVLPIINKKSDTEYEILNVLNIASSGWKTSIPTGDDGLPMFSVSFEKITKGVKVITSNPIPENRVLTLRFDVGDSPEIVNTNT